MLWFESEIWAKNGWFLSGFWPYFFAVFIDAQGKKTEFMARF